MLVQVDNLTVLYVRVQLDGDLHVTVTDGNQPVFITFSFTAITEEKMFSAKQFLESFTSSNQV